MEYNVLITGPLDCTYYSDNGFDGWNQDEVERDDFIGRFALVEETDEDECFVLKIENYHWDGEFLGFCAKKSRLRFIEESNGKDN